MVAVATVAGAPSVIAQPRVKWRLSTAWPPALRMLQGSAQRLAKVVEQMSDGRFQIEVFAADQIVKAATKKHCCSDPNCDCGK